MRRANVAAVFAVAGFLVANPARLEAQTRVAIDGGDIGGVVTGPHGPEAGVWVIAETRDLPTRYAKMVVTKAAMSFPICQRRNIRSGSAAMV